MDNLRNLALLIGRVLVAGVFIYDATLMVRFQEANVGFMEQFGVPAILMWPTAAFQFVGGLMIVAGFWTRLVALGFVGFCLATALIFHRDLGTVDTAVQFGKDAALAGGFLFLFAAGAGRWSVDGRRAETI